MCGVVCFASASRSIDLDYPLSLIAHRGPDARGVYTESKSECFLGLGHVRLSVIDLDMKANQPFISSCGNYIIVYNGEIYNYRELKTEFLNTEEFQTASDTEVLLNLYIKYGRKMLNHLDGMFAFTVYDKVQNILFCARDHLGIKPLYYCMDKEEELVFASEIKSILACKRQAPKMSAYALYEFLRNSFVYEPETGFAGIYKLGAGEYCTVSLADFSSFQKARYWLPYDAEHNKRFEIIGAASSAGSIAQEVKNSLSIQIRSDVPVGLFFSGGLDSALILSELKNKVASFTVKNEINEIKKSGMGDDYKYAVQISSELGIGLQDIPFRGTTDPDIFLKQVKQIAENSEELLADFTFSVSRDLARFTKARGYTVMLSGMGADEIFGGYPKYRLLIFPRLFCTLAGAMPGFLSQFTSLAKKIDRLKEFCTNKEFVDKYTGILGYFSKKDIHNHFILYNKEFCSIYRAKLNAWCQNADCPLKKAMLLDRHGFLAHNFAVADKSTMLASLELRVPLATKRLYELAFKKRSADLLTFFSTKIPLRKMLKGKLSKRNVQRKKTGFHPPMDKVVFTLGLERVRREFEDNGLFELIESSYIESLLQEHFKGNKNHTYKIFQLLYLSYWYAHYFRQYSYGP